MNKGHLTPHIMVSMGWIVIFYLFFGVSNGWANTYPFLYRGVRPAGMGGAFTAVADDQNAIFYNPAGLSQTESVHFAFPDPLLEFSADSIDLYQDLADADLDNDAEVAVLLRKYVGEHQHFKLALFPHVEFPVKDVGILVGGIGQAVVDTEIRTPTWPQLDVDANVDRGVLTGVGLKIPNLKGLRAGIGLKYIHRDTLNQTYTATQIAASNFEDTLDEDRQKGDGLALDLGVLYHIPWNEGFSTRIAIVGQNIPNMTLGAADDIENQYNLGVAIEKGVGRATLIAALDYLDLFNNVGADSDFPKHLHMGVEFQAPTLTWLKFAIRFGLNQGYLAGGATLRLFKVIQFDLAAYTEEVGTYAGQKEDQRYITQFSLGW